MNELSGCFGPDRCASNFGRVALLPASVAVAVATTPVDSRATSALWFSIAGAALVVGEASAVSWRYALINARLVVDMAGLTRGIVHHETGEPGH